MSAASQVIRATQIASLLLGLALIGAGCGERASDTSLAASPPDATTAESILGTIDLPEPTEAESNPHRPPEPVIFWNIDVRFADGLSFDSDAVEEVFADLLQRMSFSVYGRDVSMGDWRWLTSSGPEQRFRHLRFAFHYLDDFRSLESQADEELFSERLTQVTERMSRLGETKVDCSLPPEQAARRRQELQELRKRFDTRVAVILKPSAGEIYETARVREVLESLGLRWAGRFHWWNHSGVGNATFFSVETTTPPGKFPMKGTDDGPRQVEDLIFFYSLARSAKPLEVFDALQRAVEHTRQQLGGTIVDVDGEPADFAAMREVITTHEAELRAAGFEPGSAASLQLF